MKICVIKGQQGDNIIYTGFIKAKEIINRYKIDRWESGKTIELQGCQREPIAAHYRKIGRKLKDDENASLPTSLTLSIDSSKANLRYKKTTIKNVFEIEIEDDELIVIDGQHRILGIEYALRELRLDKLTNQRISEMELPFALITTKNRIQQIRTFYEINSTAKKVPTDLALQLLNEINMNEKYNISYGEKWKLVALNVAKNLNNRIGSVWYQSINETKKDTSKITTTTSFVSSLKPILDIKFVKDTIKLIDNEEESGNKIADLVDNYWSALAMIMPEAFPQDNILKNKWCIQKTPGLYSLHRVGAFVIETCLMEREKVKKFNTDSIANFFEQYGGHGIKSYDSFWLANDKQNGVRGGDASRANSNKEFKILAEDIIEDINENYLYSDGETIEF